jgi:hypothetical protein
MTRVLGSKGTPAIFAELSRRGLASANGPWWELEPSTAALYMAYLVGAICRTNPGLFPVTDSSQTLADLVPSGDDTSSRIRRLQYAMIMHALPVPSRAVPPLELASFKEAHREQLRRLRSYLSAKVADLAEINDGDVRAAKSAWILQEITDEVAVLREQMSKRAWPTIAVVGFGGVFGSALTLGATIANPATALALGLGITGGILAIPNALYQARELFRSRRVDPRAPLAYAALTQDL